MVGPCVVAGDGQGGRPGAEETLGGYRSVRLVGPAGKPVVTDGPAGHAVIGVGPSVLPFEVGPGRVRRQIAGHGVLDGLDQH